MIEEDSCESRLWQTIAKNSVVERYLGPAGWEFDSPYPHQERSRFSEVVFVLVVREIVVMRYARVRPERVERAGVAHRVPTRFRVRRDGQG